MIFRPLMSAPRRLRAVGLGAVALVAAVAFGATGAAAEVRVSEAAGGRLTVEAHDASVRQIIDALAAKHPIKLHTTDALARTLTGTYSGSLSRVLARILDGYDHVMHATASGIEVDVVAASPGVRTTVSAVTTVTLAPNAAGHVSSNVDLDEETTSTVGPQTVNAPASAVRPAPAVRPPPAAAPRNAQGSGAPRVSSNVDLDEETSR
jgi:hypothetical protein